VLRGREPEEVERFLGNLRVIGPAVLAPASIGVLGLGVWLVLDEALRQFTRWCWGYGVIVALLVIATWDMVTKPGL